MTPKQLIAPSEFWAFYESKRESALTKEDEHFAKKVFQYAVRLLNGCKYQSNRHSLNQKALFSAACAWIKEFEDFKRGYTYTDSIKTQGAQPRQILKMQRSTPLDHTDAYAMAMTEVLGGQVYTADNQYTMMRIQASTIFNEKRRGEHRYPRSRN
ncbi:MAG: hypothetical protein IKV03_05245 [Alphaproteobacteria bacterium]|nr:hypothetical protein [Alphaproteobacteria bacterium]